MNDSSERPALSPEVLRHALDIAPDAVMITDRDGHVMFWNAAATDLTGFSAQEAIGRHIEELLALVSDHDPGAPVLAAVTPDEPLVAEWSVRKENGVVVPIGAVVSAVTGADGEIENYIGVSVNLSVAQYADEISQLLTSITDSTTDALIAADLQGNIIWANPATRDVMGWEPSALIGQSLSVFAPEEQLEPQEDRGPIVFRGEKVAPYVTTRRKHDGTEIEVAVTLASLRDAEGNVQGLSALIRDVTADRSTERELHRAMAMHRARFDQVSMPQALVDLTGDFLDVNDALCSLVGYSREALLGRQVYFLLHPMDAGTLEDEIGGLLRGEVQSASYEKLARDADGRPLPALLYVTMLRDEDGAAYGLGIFVQDLTEVREAESRLDSLENLFRALNLRSSDAAVVLDPDLNIVYISPSVHQLFGFGPAEAVRMLEGDGVHPEDLEALRTMVDVIAAEPGASDRTVMRIQDAEGSWRWVETALTNLLQDPDVGGLVLNLRDVTAQVAAEQALRESEELHRTIVANAQEGIIAVRVDGSTLLANQRLADICGTSLAEIYQSGAARLLPNGMVSEMWDRLTSRHTDGPERYEVNWPHPDGTERVLSVSASPLRTEQEGDIGVLTMISDVTGFRRTESRLRWQALHDPLTGLPNRALLADRLEMAAARQSRTEDSRVAVLFLDLDDFKAVNDTRGHQTGDLLLKSVAYRLQEAVRRTDTVARMGGDEFAVICEDADLEVAMEVAERIRASLSEPIRIAGEEFLVATSIGLALCPPNRPQDLLAFADAAMYSAKSAGGNAVVVFDRELIAGADSRASLFDALTEALAQNLIRVSYRPIVDLVTQQVVGLQALLGWDHPVLGEISFDEVVQAAEQSGQLPALDRAFLSRACSEFENLRAHLGLDSFTYVSVTISARPLGLLLAGMVEEVIGASGLSPSSLMLEVTEGMAMADPERAAETLQALQAAGYRVSIDNFGSGYNSVRHLERVPFDMLRVDRSFVSALDTSSQAANITRSVVALANAVGLQTTAEGIATAQQARAMRDLGCGSGRGPLWPPVSKSS